MLTMTIRFDPSNNQIEINGLPEGCKVTTTPQAESPLAFGLYRYKGDDRRVLGFTEDTWFQLQRSSDGENDFFVLPAPPKREQIEAVPDHLATQAQLALYEIACSLAATGTEVWICDDDVFTRAESGRTFRLLQSGVVRLQEAELPSGARLSLSSSRLLDELCEAADMLDKAMTPTPPPHSPRTIAVLVDNSTTEVHAEVDG